MVFIGPNNSGKTSALQALSLWDIGLRRWAEKRDREAQERPGVTINRRDLLAAPVPAANLLWRAACSRVRPGRWARRHTERVDRDLRRGRAGDQAWQCGLEFDYANEESFYCRPLRRDEDGCGTHADSERGARHPHRVLPPMSGLMANEIRLDPGAIDVRIGEGRTAEVLRNLVTASPSRGGQREVAGIRSGSEPVR